MTIRVYNMVGSDGSWFSPFGWRTRALLLAKQVPVTWIELRASELREALAFAQAMTTPLLVDDSEGTDLVFKDGWSIAQHIETRFPEPRVFPAAHRPAIALFHGMIDDACQIPGFAAFSPDYFANGVIAGADEAMFRNIVDRATGRSVEANAAIQQQLIAEFRRRVNSFELQLEGHQWIFGEFSYADITLFSCFKCFATVARGIEPVLGADESFPRLKDWYQRMHVHCHINDPY